jgi:hypothetical protein
MSMLQQPNHSRRACHARHCYVECNKTQSQDEHCNVSLVTHKPCDYGNQNCQDKEPHEQKIV